MLKNQDSKALISVLSLLAFTCLFLAGITSAQSFSFDGTGRLKVNTTGSSNLLVSVTNTLSTTVADTTKVGATNVSGTYFWVATTNSQTIAQIGTNAGGTYIWMAQTNAIPAGSAVIGAVTQSGTWNIGTLTTFPDNEPFNIAQIGGQAPGVAVPVTNGPTAFTVQPGNTPNTVAWLVNVTNAISSSVGNTVALPVTNATANPYLWVSATNSTANIGNIGVTNSAGTYLWAAITNAIPTGANAIGKLAANSGVDIGDVDVTSISAGDNDIGNVDLEFAGTAASTGSGVLGAQTLRVVTATDNPVLTNNVAAAASGGASSFHLATTASTNTNIVKASAGTLYWVKAWNTNSAPIYIHVGNTAGQMATNTTRAAVIMVPGNTSGAGNNWDCGSIGMNFSTGIAFATSTTPSETNLVATVAGTGIDIGYK